MQIGGEALHKGRYLMQTRVFAEGNFASHEKSTVPSMIHLLLIELLSTEVSREPQIFANLRFEKAVSIVARGREMSITSILVDRSLVVPLDLSTTICILHGHVHTLPGCSPQMQDRCYVQQPS